MAEYTAFSHLSSSLCLSTKTLFSSSTLLHLSRPKGQCARRSGRSCFNSVWTEQIQGHPLFQSLTTLQPFLQLEPLESATQLFSTTSTSQFIFLFFFFFLSLKFLITYQPWALGFLRLIPVRRRLPSAWSTRLCVPPLTFLWASFSTPTAWLRRAQATFFSPRKRRRSSKRESRRSSSANQCCSCSLPFQNVLEPSQDEGDETQDTVEVPCSENNLKHLVECTAQALPCRPLPLWLPGEPRPRGAGETYQENGEQLTSLCRLAGSQAGLGEDLVETPTCKD